jgi:transposase InsO family protein
MGQLLHGSARTTAATRAAIQHSTESLQRLAQRYGINPKTVAKWRKRTTTADAPMGPPPASTVLTASEEAAIVAFRRHTLLPLDDCLYALQETIPALTRSSLHRCFQRHGISRLPPAETGDPRARKAFKDYPLGYLHVDFAEFQTEEGKQYLFVAIDRTSKVTFAELQPQATQAAATDFLRRVLARLPYKVNIVLTDNGIQFTRLPHHRPDGPHPFEALCEEHELKHRRTKPAHPWTNGQVERMNRTLKAATVKVFHYQTTAELNDHLQAFLLAYNHAKRLKTLRGLTPHEFICAQWQKTPAIFTQDPTHLPLGLYS